MAWPVRRVFRLTWWIICVATLCALPLSIWEFKRQGFNAQYQAWFVGGMFVIMSIPISVYEVAMHTEYYTQPRLQRHVIRILWMVPVYGIDSWFALGFLHARMYLDPIRECYEAYVLYNFFAYLMNFLEDTLGDVEAYMSQKPAIAHLSVMRYVLKPWRMGHQYLWQCKKGILNYVILRPLCTAVALITDAFGMYGHGRIDFGKSYVYTVLITNCSQMWAMYCLVMLYQATHTELSPIRPLSKFICIKALIFFSFWQSVLIAILVWTGVIRLKASVTTYDEQDVASGIQNFLICIEMLFAAIAHAHAFPPRDYMDPNVKTQGFFTNVRFMFDLRDVVIDVQEVVEDQVTRTTANVSKYSKKAVKKAAGVVKKTPQHLAELFTNAKDKMSTGSSPGGSRAALLELEDIDYEQVPVEEGASSSRGVPLGGRGYHKAESAPIDD